MVMRIGWAERALRLASLFIVLLFIAGPGWAAEDAPTVLILNSYHQGENWSDNEIDGIFDTLRERYPNLTPIVESLDTKRFPAPSHLTTIKDYLLRKYRDRRIDVILALDNPALELLRNNSQDLFPGVPIVFAGINGYQAEMIGDLRQITGVIERQDVAGTVRMALALQPGIKQVLAIHDYTASGLAVRQEAEAALAPFADKLDIRYSANQPFADLSVELRAMPKNGLVLILTYVTDQAGQTFSRGESTRLITEMSPAPVYAMHETRLGFGIIGGMLLEGHEHGRQAADLVQRVLDGEAPQSLPVQESRSRGIVDFAGLQRLGIPEGSWPKDIIIHNRPVSFWQSHRQVLIPALISLTLVSLLALLLGGVVVRLRRTQADLRCSEERLRDLIDSIGEGLILQAADERILLMNQMAAKLFAVQVDEVAGRPASSHDWQTIREDGSPFPVAEHPSLHTLRTGEARSGVIMGVAAADGSTSWIQINTRPLVTDQSALPYAAIISFADITARKIAAESLRKSETNFRTFFASMTDMLFVADVDGRILRTNEILGQVLGYDPDTLLSMVIADLYPAEQRQEAEAWLAAMISGEVPESHLPMCAKNGQIVPVVTRVWLGSWNGGDCLYGICRNRSSEVEAEQRFELLFRHNPALMAFSSSLTKVFVDVNDAWLATTGYQRSEVVGKTSGDLQLFPCLEEYQLVAAQLRDHGHISNCELQIRCKDGSLRYGLFSGEQVPSQGQTYFLTVMIDITERRRAEQILRTTLERTQVILASIHTGILMLSADNRVEYANQSFCKQFNLPEQAGELIGLVATEIIGKVSQAYADPPQALARISEIVAANQPVNNELVAMAGGRTFLRDYIPIIIGGENFGRLWHHADITERKQVEDALERRMFALLRPLDNPSDIAIEELFNLEDLQKIQDDFARATGVASIIARPDGTPITEPSNFCRLCAEIIRGTENGRINCRQSDALIGRACLDGPTIQPCLSGGLWDAGAAITVGGRHIASWLIGQVRDETQTEEQMRAYARLIGTDEQALVDAFWEVPAMSRTQFTNIAQALFTLATRLSSAAYQNVQQARFITELREAEAERKQLQSQLGQAQKMEAIGTLAGGIAHDFNNILGAIIGYAEMAWEDCPQDSALSYDIRQILDAGNRAKELVRQILAFSRQVETDQIPLKPATIILEVIKLLRASLPTTITITREIDSDAGIILADPTQIHQIVMNLCTNAFHAMEAQGGILSITLGKRLLTEAEHAAEAHLLPGEYVQLIIADTGMGMEPSVLAKIFDPYFTTKDVGKGTGMGLAMVHGIVQACGGSIHCTSQVGVGTRFQILLPTIDRPVELSLESAASPAGGREHILFIDDEQVLVDMARNMLERLGYQVTTQTDSSAALTVFSQQPNDFQLIITDQTMPGLTGAELSRRILAIRPDMPIILCTGYSNLISAEKAKDIGIRGFSYKPLVKKDIAALIREVLAETASAD